MVRVKGYTRRLRRNSSRRVRVKGYSRRKGRSSSHRRRRSVRRRSRH
jgi:hypothetical protein